MPVSTFCVLFPLPPPFHVSSHLTSCSIVAVKPVRGVDSLELIFLWVGGHLRMP